MQEPTEPHGATIGVFDSGVGGLSVLRELLAELPGQRFAYVADSAYNPYGERSYPEVIARTRAITAHLRRRHPLSLLVVACNTATAAAIAELRAEHPDLPIVGLEPALKPAAHLSHTHRIGVLATRGTLHSAKFRALAATLADQAEFVLQPCDGLASAIERHDVDSTARLCANYLQALGPLGPEPDQIDTVVLGCTHYAFALDTLCALAPSGVQFVDAGAPVARQARRVLELHGYRLGPRTNLPNPTPCNVGFAATSHPDRLQAAVQRWLGLRVKVETLQAWV